MNGPNAAPPAAFRAQDLIPGDPAALRAAARHWRALADTVDDSSQGLSDLDTGPWQGPAAQAFATRRASIAPSWSRASSALRSSAASVEQYADTLEWGQRQAASMAASWYAAQGSPDQQAQALDGLVSVRAQVRQAGDDARLSVRDASAIAAEPGSGSAGDGSGDGAGEPGAGAPGGGPGADSIDPQEPPNEWDELPGSDHPNPSDIHRDWKGDDHILTGHESGTHLPNKRTFPESWSKDENGNDNGGQTILKNAEDVARNPDQPPVEQQDKDGGTSWICTGTRDGVRMEVIVESDGRIRTAYPLSGRGVRQNDKNGESHELYPGQEQEEREQEAREQEALDRERDAQTQQDEAQQQDQEDDQRELEDLQGESEAEDQEQKAEQTHDEQGQAEAEREREAYEEDQQQTDENRDEAQQEEHEAQEEHEVAEQEYDQAVEQEAADGGGD
jgi:hypothetical protein